MKPGAIQVPISCTEMLKDSRIVELSQSRALSIHTRQVLLLICAHRCWGIGVCRPHNEPLLLAFCSLVEALCELISHLPQRTDWRSLPKSCQLPWSRTFGQGWSEFPWRSFHFQGIKAIHHLVVWRLPFRAHVAWNFRHLSLQCLLTCCCVYRAVCLGMLGTYGVVQHHITAFLVLARRPFQLFRHLQGHPKPRPVLNECHLASILAKTPFELRLIVSMC